MEDNKFVLEVSDLHTTFKTDNGDVLKTGGLADVIGKVRLPGCWCRAGD